MAVLASKQAPQTRSRVLMEGSRSSNLCRLRGLPFSATEADITEFFAGFDLKHLHICRRAGKPDEACLMPVDAPVASRQPTSCASRGAFGRVTLSTASQSAVLRLLYECTTPRSAGSYSAGGLLRKAAVCIAHSRSPWNS